MNNTTLWVGIGIIAAVLLVMNIRRSPNQAGNAGGSSVKEKIAAGALVVDVRSPGEFAGGHYPGALNIPVDQVAGRIAEFGEKSRPVIVYCASGGRSGHAKMILDNAGYQDVTNAGGLFNMPR